MTSDTYVHVSFITLGNEGDGDYEWISHGTSARRLTDNLSSLRKCVIRNIREKKTNVEHLLDLIDLDFFLLYNALQGNGADLKEACKAIVGAKSFENAAVKLKAYDTFESLGFEALDEGEWSNRGLTALEYKLVVVARLPSAGIRTRPRVEDIGNSKGSTGEVGFLKDLHTMYWGKSIPSKTLNIILSSVEQPDDDRSMDSPTTLPYIDLPNSRSLDKLVVRKDYEAAYEFLESLFRKDLEENSDLSGGVICGHPGIGKSLFLYYCLARRLSEGNETVYTGGPREVVYHFSHSGVKSTSARVAEAKSSLGTWALVDAGQSACPPSYPIVSYGFGNPFFVVQATTPEVTRYKDWVKQRGAIKYWMKPWTWDEIWAGQQLHRTVKNVDVTKLRTFFDNYGGSPRDVYRSCHDMRRADLEASVVSAVSGMDLELLERFSRHRVEDLWSSAELQSSTLFIIRPSLDSCHSARFDFASQFILKLLTEKFAGNVDEFNEIVLQLKRVWITS